MAATDPSAAQDRSKPASAPLGGSAPHKVGSVGAPIEYLLHLADNALVLGQRNAEWCGHGPVLEEDLALANNSLDLIGQARLLYQHAASSSTPTRPRPSVSRTFRARARTARSLKTRWPTSATPPSSVATR